MKNYVAITAILLFVFTGCKKDTNDVPVPDTASLYLKLGYNVDLAVLQFDTIKYVNAAGNQYGVDRLQFYLSGFQIKKTDGTWVSISNVIYVDAKTDNGLTYPLSNVPYGDYKEIKFYVGLDSAHNITGALPNTVINANMQWPETMGGGYHFMKFEGNYLSGGTSFGFAMHLGKNQNLVSIDLLKNFSFSDSNNKLQLNMNLNEWFTNPNIYDFDVDGNYSMSNDAAMAKLKANGADVFNN